MLTSPLLAYLVGGCIRGDAPSSPPSSFGQPQRVFASELVDGLVPLDELPEQRAPARLGAKRGRNLEEQALHPPQEQGLGGKGHVAHLLQELGVALLAKSLAATPHVLGAKAKRPVAAKPPGHCAMCSSSSRPSQSAPSRRYP